MKVKVFSAMTESGLEKKINEFLKENNVDVQDIKFSMSNVYGAIVIYKDK